MLRRTEYNGIMLFFFFKQKTAYEIQYGLVGSEMCIRDSSNNTTEIEKILDVDRALWMLAFNNVLVNMDSYSCLLYTSDAADERSSVDLGGRRIIKKKKKNINLGISDITKSILKKTTLSTQLKGHENSKVECCIEM